MNKKGFTLSFEMLWWIPKLFYLIIVSLTTSTIILAFIVTNVDVTATEAQIIMNRILYSPTGMNYYDNSIQRTYPGVIDLEKFTSTQLKNILVYEGTPLAIKAKLVYESGSAEIFYNENKYNDWLPLAEAGIQGYGGARMHVTSQYVLVKQGSQLIPGRIEIRVITLNA